MTPPSPDDSVLRRYEVSGVTTVTRSYFFGGARIAQKVGAGALTWLHGDHLGSTATTWAARP